MPNKQTQHGYVHFINTKASHSFSSHTLTTVYSIILSLPPGVLAGSAQFIVLQPVLAVDDTKTVFIEIWCFCFLVCFHFMSKDLYVLSETASRWHCRSSFILSVCHQFSYLGFSTLCDFVAFEK